MIDYIISNLPALLGALLAIGVVWAYASKILVVVKEVADLLNAILVALADRNLTKEEINTIIEEAKHIPIAIKGLLKK
ncbi:MAG: hypothetical protein PHG53_09600 [Phycisphaerae bacterium]|nr:hypothetical protein [Phycisphaerae bacterium]